VKFVNEPARHHIRLEWRYYNDGKPWLAKGLYNWTGIRAGGKLMEIMKYSIADESLLFDMLIDEGDEWSDYHGLDGRSKYIKALETSITYIAYDDALVCGYARCREDDGFGVYVYDLLVRKSYRGKQIGKYLMERVCQDFPEQPVYVMSDVDRYYEKLGYRREGSIFVVKP
jgi:ribosomal protein S18 acetylase RimI-like enzyme